MTMGAALGDARLGRQKWPVRGPPVERAAQYRPNRKSTTGLAAGNDSVSPELT